MAKTLLKQAWNLWEKAEKGWESAEAEGEKPEALKVPKGEKKDIAYEKPEITVAKTTTPSELNSLEKEMSFVPGKDKDAKVMQLKTELASLEESLIELELEEAFMTPDTGTSVLGRSLFTGAALQPPNGYDRNFDPDDPAPEASRNSQDQDAAATLIAPKQFVPKEGVAKVMEAIEWNRKTRLAKLF
jgi:hypothetical protein